MAVKDKKPDEELEVTTTPYFKPTSNIRRKYAITVYLTDFQRNQVKTLVNIGIASSGTAFARMGILELVRQNKHLLSNQMLAGKHKRRKPKKEYKSEYLDNLVKRVLEGEENISPDEIILLRSTLTKRLIRKKSFTDKEIQAIKKAYLKKKSQD